jgi:tight adherence protein C
MMGAGLLLVGLGASAAAVLVGLPAVLASSTGRAGVAKTLATIDQVYRPGRAPEVDESFSDRILAPLSRRAGSLGRALTPAGVAARMQRSLDHAGNPPAWPVERILQAKGIGLVALGLFGLLFGGVVLGGTSGLLLGGLVGAALGAFLPDLLLHNLGDRRQQEIRRTLADILDMLTVSVEAGLGFDAALGQVARNGKGPMVGEIARVLQEIRIGNPRAEALRAMAARTTAPELRSFAMAVVQATELGIPIGAVLRVQSKEMRLRRRQNAEGAAQKVPVKILFPMLFLIFPALFVVIIGPGALKVTQLF